MIAVRYPGRVCLLGEHCDWAGGASLTAALAPLWVEVVVEGAAAGLCATSELDGELVEAEWPDTGLVAPEGGPLRFAAAAAQALAAQGIGPGPAALWCRATLPTGRGFSSSAAFCLAVLDALARWHGHVLERSELAELAYVVEHDLLGVQCGRLDQLACAAGQPLFLRWTDGRAEPVPVRPRQTFHLVAGAFRQPRDTRGILATLNHHQAGPPSHGDTRAVREALDTWATQAYVGWRALEAGDATALGEAMNAAQDAYEAQLARRFDALKAPGLVRTCAGLRRRGALGAKFSGAGGDGSVVGLFEDQHSAMAAVEWLDGQGVVAWYSPVEAS